MENTFYAQRLLGGSVNESANVVFDNVVFNSGDITYNAVTGVITFNSIGKYHVNWWVATQSVSSSTNAVFSIISSNGVNTKGNSPIKLNSFSGFAIIDVVTAPVTISLVNTTGIAYYSPTVPTKAMISVNSVVESAGSSDTMYDFQIRQLTNILSQIITKYPTNTISLFVRGLYYITGNPTSIFYSTSGPGLFIVTEDDNIQAVPFNMITAVYAGDGSTYDATITYLPEPTVLPTGWDTQVIISVLEYLSVGDAVSVYFSIGNSRDGYVYKNECGMLVITADMAGSNPTFIPATEASIFITSSSDSATKKLKTNFEV